ncbi:MAG TPA: rhodanese-like domain-containing protein [Gaiellales bacterium]|nr:rhodanese-like domain-containing protein [Gaiellales bacterium]
MGIDDLLGRSRAGLARLTPQAAQEAVRAGAVIVDMRPLGQRRAEGVVPGAVVVCRNVLEWRADGSSGHADDRLVGKDLIVMCAEGYSSSLAAATLQEIGLAGATDMIGGFEAWRDAGLPVEPCPD